MDRDEVRRQCKASALASLRSLAAAFAGERDVESSISHTIESIEAIDVKPARPAVGVVVIGEAVAAAPPLLQDGKASSSSERKPKRPRRRPTESVESRTLDDFPIGCAVLLPRHDDGGNKWNSYCLVVGHTADGMLELEVPDPGEDEGALLTRSIFSLGSGLGNEETRPLKRPSSGNQGGTSASAAFGSACGGACGDSSSSTSAPGAVPASNSAAVEPSPVECMVERSGVERSGVHPPEEDERSAVEQMAGSRLRLSSGRTREQLNQNLSALGLTAKFGQTVVSAREGIVSQLTFNIGEWNDLPADERAPHVWWLGEGAKRLQLANLIHPQFTEHPARGVPLFFAVKRSTGGSLCHYGGHYTTNTFTVLAEHEKVHFKERDRQARIEFAFHHFDETLAAAIEATPAER